MLGFLQKSNKWWRRFIYACLIIDIYWVSYVIIMLAIGPTIIVPPPYTSNAILPGKPVPSQAAVDKAVKHFNIQIPWSAVGPFYNADMGRQTRGTASTHAMFPFCYVEIGKSAFDSWGRLGGTLAHELEVHCKQNMTLAYFRELMGEDRDTPIEREAYTYVILNSKRLNLTDREIRITYRTMNSHYPLGVKNESKQRESK